MPFGCVGGCSFVVPGDLWAVPFVRVVDRIERELAASPVPGGLQIAPGSVKSRWLRQLMLMWLPGRYSTISQNDRMSRGEMVYMSQNLTLRTGSMSLLSVTLGLISVNGWSGVWVSAGPADLEAGDAKLRCFCERL